MSYLFDFVDDTTGTPVPVSGLTFTYDHTMMMVTDTPVSDQIRVDLIGDGVMLAADGVTFRMSVTSTRYAPVDLEVPASYPEQTVRLMPASAPVPLTTPPGRVGLPIGTNGITSSSLNGSAVLADGDRIALTVRPDTVGGAAPDPNMLRLELTASAQAHWWKGVYLWDGYATVPGFELFTIVGREFLLGPDFNVTTSLSARIPLSSLRNRAIILGKAKFLGFHVNMYGIETADLTLLGGSVLSFDWVDQGFTFPG
jgi:hypothetical protein